MTSTTCQRLGHSFKIRLDMIRATTGMQSSKAPLSEAVVIRMPIVSQIEDGNTCQRFKIPTVNIYPTSTDEKIEVNKKEGCDKTPRD